MARERSFDAAKKLAEALAATGLARPDLAREFRPGAVCSLNDAAIDFPTDRLPGAGERTEHGRRRAIVMQCRPWSQSKAPPTLLVVPCSASHRGGLGPWDVHIPDETPGFTKEKVVAYTSLVQPVLKSDVVVVHGHVDADTLQVLFRTLAQLLDLSAMA